MVIVFRVLMNPEIEFTIIEMKMVNATKTPMEMDGLAIGINSFPEFFLFFQKRFLKVDVVAKGKFCFFDCF